MGRDIDNLRVRRQVGELHYEYISSSGEVGFKPKAFDEGEVRDLVNRIFDTLRSFAESSNEGPLTYGQLERLGGALCDQVLTKKVTQELARKKLSSFLQLNLSRDLTWLPWELLHDGEHFLGQRFIVGRILSQREDDYRSGTQQPKPKALIAIGNVSGLEVEDEKANVLDAPKAVLVPEMPSLVTRTDLLSELKSGYTISHFMGHGKYSADEPKNTGWQCVDGMLSCHDIKNVATKASFPFLVFSNACESAAAAPTEGDYVSDLHAAFLSQGVRHYIGTVAPVHDRWSGEFAVKFYQALVQDETVGGALWKAKEFFFRKAGPPIWAYYVHYGRGQEKLPATKSVGQSDTAGRVPKGGTILTPPVPREVYDEPDDKFHKPRPRLGEKVSTGPQDRVQHITAPTSEVPELMETVDQEQVACPPPPRPLHVEIGVVNAVRRVSYWQAAPARPLSEYYPPECSDEIVEEVDDLDVTVEVKLRGRPQRGIEVFLEVHGGPVADEPDEPDEPEVTDARGQASFHRYGLVTTSEYTLVAIVEGETYTKVWGRPSQIC